VKLTRPAPKGATDFEALPVSLKRYPDTNPLIVFVLALFIFFSGGLFSGNVQLWAQSPTWQQIPIPKLPAFHPAQPKRIELPNGMVVFLQEDHELPTIDGTARIRGGERSVPANKTGLTDVYGEVWRTGGTKTQTGDQLDDYLEQRAPRDAERPAVSGRHEDLVDPAHQTASKTSTRSGVHLNALHGTITSSGQLDRPTSTSISACIST